MARSKLKFCILGYGSIGQRHAKNLKMLGHEVHIYDPDPVHILDCINRENLIEWSDAILVCSPSKQHFADLKDAVKADKHVFVEKPFAYDCPPLVEGFLRGARSRLPSQVIATGFNLRFHDCVRETRKMLGSLGLISMAKFHVLQKPNKPAYLMDGIIRNWCSHELDLAMYLLGQMEVVDCFATHDSEGRDTIDASIKLKRGKLEAFIEADYITEPQKRFFWIHGEKGTMYVDLEARTLTIDYVGNPLPYVYKGEDSWDQNYVSEMMAFVRSCQNADDIEYGNCAEPLAPGEAGVENLYAIVEARELARVTDK